MNVTEIKMDIIEIKTQDLKSQISLYQTCNRRDPIVLMNKDTYNFLRDRNMLDFIFMPDEEENPTICNCRLAIASWLSFGEVLLR